MVSSATNIHHAHWYHFSCNKNVCVDRTNAEELKYAKLHAPNSNSSGGITDDTTLPNLLSGDSFLNATESTIIDEVYSDINSTASTVLDTTIFNSLEHVFFEDRHSQMFYINLYTILIVGATIFTVLRSWLFFKICMHASKVLHNTMFSNILQATMRFFDTNPSGKRNYNYLVFNSLFCWFKIMSKSNVCFSHML